MSNYKYLLFDNDGTIMDFGKAEEYALKDTYRFFNFDKPYTKDILDSYSACNLRWWKKHELGLCTKEELIVARFEEFLQEQNLEADAFQMNEMYRAYLSLNNQLIDGALEVLKDLSKNYKIYIITNGVADTQHGRIETSPINEYIDKLYISEEVGYSKPDARFFENVLIDLKINDKSECLIIGDSLSSDIKGANNAGIDCVWYNPNHEKQFKLKIQYEIDDIHKIKEIVQFKQKDKKLL